MKVSDRSELPKRILLLLTARTYRARAFKTAAERLGVEVCAAVDMRQELAEYWNYPLGVNFSDSEATISTVRDFAKRKPIGAILAVDDSGGTIAAQISKALNLRHNSPESAVAAHDKFIMRTLLREGGVKIPSFNLHRLSTQAEPRDSKVNELAREQTYPCVIKPVNLSGSRGVIRVNSEADFKKAVWRLQQIILTYEPSSDPTPLLIESYIGGLELALEGILDEGVLHVLALFDKPDPLTGPYFEETIYVTPSRLSIETQNDLISCVSDAAEVLGLRNGPIHAEIRVNEDGPYLIEIAGRSIGGLCSQTLRFGIDVSLEELIIRQALGMDFTSHQREDCASGVMMIPIPQKGILRGVNGIREAENIPLVEEVQITARLNYSLVPLPEGDSYLGFIFARGDSPGAVENALRQAHRELIFDITPELEISPSHKFFNLLS